MLSIFPCVYWVFLNHLCWNTYSNLKYISIFKLGGLSSCCWVLRILYIFWILFEIISYACKTVHSFRIVCIPSWNSPESGWFFKNLHRLKFHSLWCTVLWVLEQMCYFKNSPTPSFLCVWFHSLCKMHLRFIYVIVWRTI